MTKTRDTNEKLTAKKIDNANIGIDKEGLELGARILNHVLADGNLLYIKTRNYHWNVTGIHFRSLHKLLEEQYEALAITIDAVAERVRKLGYRAIGTMASFIEHSHLKEDQSPVLDAKEMIQNLVNDHEIICQKLREGITRLDEETDDIGTVDFLTDVLQQHEKMAWMLRSHLE